MQTGLHKLNVRLEHGHSPEAIHERLSRGPRHSYMRDWVYGAIDGAVTTFAVVSGVIGAELSPVVILVLGFANLIADGFSMAASNYLGTKTEQEDLRHLEAIEHRHIQFDPEGEKEEVRQIFRDKGFSGDDLESALALITSDRDRWVRTMLTEEYGLPGSVRPPHLAALCTFSAFIVCGFIPLLPFVLDTSRKFTVSTIATGLTFFAVGAIKANWSTRPWWKSGIETLSFGSLAAGLAFGVGHFLKGLLQ